LSWNYSSIKTGKRFNLFIKAKIDKLKNLRVNLAETRVRIINGQLKTKSPKRSRRTGV